MIALSWDKPTAFVAAVHVVLALLCAGWLGLDAAPIGGVHPALKPMKFGISIAVFLASASLILPMLSTSQTTRAAISWLLTGTMVLEMAPIVVQALRGTTSHFNLAGAGNSAAWRMMLLAIVVATFTMMAFAALASIRPLHYGPERPLDAAMSLAVRAGLWMFLLAAVSGFAMGGRLKRSVGGGDGGPGLPLLNWSRIHGDLRVSHFMSLHAMQSLPAIAWALSWAPMGPSVRVACVAVAVAGHLCLAIGTLMQAFAGRAFWP